MLKRLFEAASKASEASSAAWEAGDYDAVVAVPATLVPAINKFFEDVMVMDKDEAIKANRFTTRSFSIQCNGYYWRY